jgi:hypothetical protein
MKTLKLFNVTFEGMGLKRMTLPVAAKDKKAAEKQTLEYSKTVKRVFSTKQIGVVNVPVVA